MVFEIASLFLCIFNDISSEKRGLGAIHLTKISGNFGLKLNGSVRLTGKVSKKAVRLSRWTSFLGWTGPIEMDRSI